MTITANPRPDSNVGATLSISTPEPKPTENLTKLEKLPSVELIITDLSGRVLGTFSSGINPNLAHMLSDASQMDDPNCPVIHDKEVLTVLGQDFYVVTREYVLMSRGAFYPRKLMDDIRQLEKSMPETARYTFVVSY